METIKKYSNNRKLYSTTLSKYVTLNYILDLVRGNQRFQVVDNKTEVDVTSLVKRQALGQLDLSDDMVTALIRGN